MKRILLCLCLYLLISICQSCGEPSKDQKVTTPGPSESTISTHEVEMMEEETSESAEPDITEESLEDERTIEDVTLGEEEENHINTDDLSLTVDPQNLDHEVLTFYILDGINQLRRRQGYRQLLPRRNLRDAADLQNQHCISLGALSHSQPSPQFQSVRERVVHFGGRFDRVGENVQYYGLLNSRIGDEVFIRPTSYRTVVDGIIDNWVESPGHYRNLMDPDYTFVGTAIGWHDDLSAIFVTQVYGGDN